MTDPVTRAAHSVTPPGTPRYLLDDPVGRRWLAVHVIDHPTRGWDSGDVDHALERAHELLRLVGGAIGPKADRGFWPALFRDVEDLAGRDAEPSRPRVPAEAISAMEAVLGWLGRYVPGGTPESEALQLWCFCAERRIAYRTACQRLGRNITTENRRRRRGSLLIAAGLCMDDVPIPAEVLAARRERPRSDMAGTEDPAAPAPVSPVVAAVPPPAQSPDPALAAFWAEVAAVQAIADAAARADAVYRLIHARVRAEGTALAGAADMPARLSRRRVALVHEAVSRGLLDTGAIAAARRDQTADGQLPYRYEAGAATVQVTQSGGWYGAAATWRTDAYEYVVIGPRAAVESALADLLRAYPPHAYATRFDPIRNLDEPGLVGATGWRSASAD